MAACIMCDAESAASYVYQDTRPSPVSKGTEVIPLFRFSSHSTPQVGTEHTAIKQDKSKLHFYWFHIPHYCKIRTRKKHESGTAQLRNGRYPRPLNFVLPTPPCISTREKEEEWKGQARGTIAEIENIPHVLGQKEEDRWNNTNE